MTVCVCVCRRSSTDTAFTTPPSSPKSTTRNKLHKARASQRERDEDASGAGRTSSSSRSRSELRDEGHSRSKERREGRGAEDANPRHHNHRNHDHHGHDHDHDHRNHQSHRDTSAERHRSRDEGRRQQPSSRSRDNLRAQSPGRRHAQDSARPPPSPTTHSGSCHGSESYFTWPRKRQTRQRSDDRSAAPSRFLVCVVICAHWYLIGDLHFSHIHISFIRAWMGGFVQCTHARTVLVWYDMVWYEARRHSADGNTLMRRLS